MRAKRSMITILPLGGYAMRYLIFSWCRQYWRQTAAALFLTACADPDNPVVSTAPAGKALQQQPPGTNQPSSKKLVGNLLQTRDGSPAPFSHDIRQDFTTGSSHDWKLTKVILDMKPSTPSPIYTVEIWRKGSDGTLTGRRTLTRPNTLVDGWNDFTGNIDLTANTTYAVVMNVSGGGTAGGWYQTLSENEDSGAEAGWSINLFHLRQRDQTNWLEPSQTFKNRMEIHGYAKSSVTVGVPATQNRAARSETIELPLRSTLTGEVLDEYVPKYYGSMLAECQRLRSASSGGHDYSQWDEWTDGDGRKIRVRTQAANGWRWVYTYSNGRVTGSRPATVDECAQDKLSERKVWCDAYGDREGNEGYCAGL